MSHTLSLIVPCYNEARTIEACVEKILGLLENKNLRLEIIVVDDASSDGSWRILEKIAGRRGEIRLFKHEKNRGKGAALRTGFIQATGDFVGIQDADAEYDPQNYLVMLEPLLDGRADVVYGSRYLRPDTRRVLYFWHTWMNKTLTAVSNMFTNLDITDMETCCKLFRRELIQKIAPELKEERFVGLSRKTARVAEARCRVYECAISYNPRTYEEGKKIGWKDGVHALYCIFHYSAHRAPLPMQILIYLFIGAVALAVNMGVFSGGVRAGMPVNHAIVLSFAAAALCNYLLCIALLFRHKARWNTAAEVFWYAVTVLVMGIVDFAATRFLIDLIPFFAPRWSAAKLFAALAGFAGNFVLRKTLVFPEKNKEGA